MMQDGHLGEVEDHRSVYLRTIHRIWIVPVSGVCLALLFFLIYTAVIVTVQGQRQYETTATYELSFAYNENTQTAYDYYNAATWQGLLFTHPGIYETIEAELPAGMTLEEAQADTKADLISDIRFLSVTVTCDTKEKAEGLSKAIQDALVQFGESAKEFDSITFLSATEPELVTVQDRSRNAALLGLVLGLVFSALFLWLREILDDAVYTPEEVRRRYQVPALAVTGKKGSAPLPAFLEKETRENLQELLQKTEGNICLAGLSDKEEKAAAAALADPRFVPAGDTDPSGKTVLLVLFWGSGKGTRTEHLLERLLDRGAKVPGAVLLDSDGKFLRRYYREPGAVHTKGKS
ncbi:MAG: hypothetical protein ACI4OJ_05615 [Lachnospiraceae bacterium]